MVAILALVTATLLGLVPMNEMFQGFGHPATVTVALVLILSRGLQNAGPIAIVSKWLQGGTHNDWKKETIKIVRRHSQSKII